MRVLSMQAICTVICSGCIDPNVLAVDGGGGWEVSEWDQHELGPSLCDAIDDVASHGPRDMTTPADMSVAARPDEAASQKTFSGFVAAPTLWLGPVLPATIVAADFDGDGNRDLVVGTEYELTNNPTANLKLFRGHNDGTFSLSSVTPAGYQVGAAAAADFDGDGKLDLAVCDFNSCGVLPGRGAAGFGVAVVVSTAECFEITIGDFDGDMRPDLVFSGCIGGSPDRLFVFLNRGGFHFDQTAAFNGNGAIAVDLNGDGRSDLFTGPIPTTLLSSGDGTFRTVSVLSNYAAERSFFAAGDLNGDGKVDIVDARTGQFASPPNVQVLFGHGDGTIAAGPALALAASTVALADLDGDGRLDLVFRDGDLASALGRGDGTFAPVASYGLGHPQFGRFIVGDFNSDGRPDVVALERYEAAVILLGRGNGTLVAATARPGTWSAALGDFNGDSTQDLIATHDNSLAIDIGDGRGGFIDGKSISIPSAVAPLPGDFDGDGKLDAVVSVIPNGIAFVRGKGNGTLATPADLPGIPKSYNGFNSAPNLEAGDIDGDGHLDLFASESGQLWLLHGHGDGAFDPPALVSTPVQVWTVRDAVADVNEDGRADLVLPTDPITVMFGRTDGTLAPPTSAPLSFGGRSVLLGDIDGDGHKDAITISNGGPDALIRIAYGHGDGTFEAPVIIVDDSVETSSVAQVAIGDFNGDGHRDIVSFDDGRGARILLGLGARRFAWDQGTWCVGDTTAATALAADLNHDGRDDLVMTGNMSVILSR